MDINKYEKEELIELGNITSAVKVREEGIEKGIQEGRETERQKSLCRVIKILKKRFGIITDDLKNKIDNLSLVSIDLIIDKMIEDVIEIDSIEDIRKYF